MRLTKTVRLLVGALALGASLAHAQQAPRKLYIVQLDEMPLAAYKGTINGLPATKPTAGRKLDVRSSAARAYVNYLNQRQTSVLTTAAPAAQVVHSYRNVFPGFSAKLTDAEASKLATSRGVRAVVRDEVRRADTLTTPQFLGLTAPGGLYEAGVKGENVIIGVIDSGIAPENPAFSDKVDANGVPVASHLPGTVVYQPITNFRPWNGTCETGPGVQAADCNNKLIGIRAFKAGATASNTLIDTEFPTGRDIDGHGSHTASTAGGNAGVPVTLQNIPLGGISGIAPRARIASYKALWYTSGDPTRALGNTSDLVDAIDTAVADGVDVINYSISGSRFNLLDPVEVSFLFAADAGVFVAASAGNDGPGNTVAHNSPWITTVAASTHDRLFVADATLGGVVYNGPSLNVSGLGSPASQLPLILSTDATLLPFASLTANEQTAVRLCFNATDRGDASLGLGLTPNAVLDPAKVAGKIVVCDRGANARVNKSAAVAAAGGAGMVLLNTGANTLNDDLHAVPTVHLSHTVRTAVRTLAASGTGTGWFAPRQLTSVVAPTMASFSSRGPNLADPFVLKPDVTAPGVGVLAATAHFPADAAEQATIAAGNRPPAHFDFLQGTSMSSPHIAGVAALLKQAKPNWSPAAAKSAIMTTATQVKLANGAADAARFGYGAGHVNPNGAAAADLVYDAGTIDYFAYLCGDGWLNPTGSTCNAAGFIAPWQLNLASITSPVLGFQRLSRTVTNTSGATVTYTASASVPGFNVSVSPATLQIPAGGSASYTVTALSTGAPLNTWAFGNVVLTNGSKTLTSPLTLLPLGMDAPANLADSRVRANKAITVGTGYNGTARATTLGLVPSVRRDFASQQGVQDCSAQVVVPAGAQFVRISLFDADTSGQGRDDLDLFVYNAAGTLVGAEADGDSNETVILRNPAAGTYTVCVDGFDVSGGAGTYTLSHWVGTAANATPNSLRVIVPQQVTIAGTATVNFAWAVASGNRHFGVVNFADGAGAAISRTDMLIDGIAPAGTLVTDGVTRPALTGKKAVKAANLQAKMAR